MAFTVMIFTNSQVLKGIAWSFPVKKCGNYGYKSCELQKTWLRLLYGLIQLMKLIMNDGFGKFCELLLNI